MRFSTISTFAIGPLGAAALGAITLPLIAWIYPPEVVGQFNVLQVTVPLLINSVLLGLDQAFVREYHEQGSRQGLILRTMLPPIIMVCLLLIPVAIAPDAISQLLFSSDDPRLAWLLFLSTLCSLLIRQGSLIARMSERGFLFSAGQTVPKVILIVGLLAVALAVAHPGIASLMFVYILSLAITAVFIGVATRQSWKIASPDRDDKGAFARLLKFSLPLWASAFLYSALGAVGTLFLRANATLQDIGVYAVALSIGAVAGLVQGVFSIVWSPIIYKAVANGNGEKAVSTGLKGIAIVFGLVLALTGLLSWIVPFVLPAYYADIRYLVVGTVFIPMLYMVREAAGMGIAIRRRTMFSVGTTALALAISLALNALLTPRFGAFGAVASSVVALWVLFVSNTEISARIWFAPKRLGLHAVVAIGTILALFTLWMGTTKNDSYIWLWTAFILVILGSSWKYRKVLLSFVRRQRPVKVSE